MRYDDIGHYIISPYGRSLEDISLMKHSFDDVAEHIATLITTGINIEHSFDIENDLTRLAEDYETLPINKIFTNYVSSELKEKFLSSFVKTGKLENIITHISQDILLMIDHRPELESFKILIGDLLNKYIEEYKNSVIVFEKNEDGEYNIQDHICGNLFTNIVAGIRVETFGQKIQDSFSLVYNKYLNLYSSQSEYFNELTIKGIFDALGQTLNSVYYLILNGLILERMVALDILRGLELDVKDDVQNYKDEEIQDENIFSTERDHAFANIGGIGDKLKSKGKIGKVADFFENTSTTLNSVKKKFNLFTRKNKNYLFYRRYLGRIDHLYERYSDAEVQENRMHGDPVEILKGKAKDYIEKYIRDNVKIYKQVSDLMNKIEDAAPDIKTCLKILKPFLGQYAMNENGIKKLPKMMLKATKHHIAEALLENNRVYGYTVDSIVEKNFPPANHTVVSLFVDAAHEKPIEQRVSDIFESADSFKLLAANTKRPIFDIAEISQNLLKTGITSGSMKSSLSNVKKSLTKPKKDVGDEEKGSKVEGKKLKLIYKALEGSLNYIASMKAYGSKLIETYFAMMMRIDNLGKICVKSMLNSEREATDERHKTGFKSTKFSSHKGYTQNEDTTKTAGQKERELKEARETARAERKERIKELREEMQKSTTIKWI